MFRFFKNLVQLILSPAHAWEEVDQENLEPETLAAQGVYPLLALVAVTSFVQGLYARTFELGAMLQLAIAEFVALLATYFIGTALIDTFGNRFASKGLSIKKVRTVVLYTVALLAVIQVIENLVPVELTVVKFLPAFAAIVLCRANAYLTIDKDKEGAYILLSIASVIIPWFILKTLLIFIL